MGVVRSAGGSTGSAEPVEESAESVRLTGAGARVFGAGWLSLCGARFAGARR